MSGARHWILRSWLTSWSFGRSCTSQLRIQPYTCKWNLQLFRDNKATYAASASLQELVMVVPITNYWWPCLQAEVSKNAFKELVVPQQRILSIAHIIGSIALPVHDPGVASIFSCSATDILIPKIFNKHDMEVLQKMMAMPRTMEVNHIIRFM